MAAQSASTTTKVLMELRNIPLGKAAPSLRSPTACGTGDLPPAKQGLITDSLCVSLFARFVKAG